MLRERLRNLAAVPVRRVRSIAGLLERWLHPHRRRRASERVRALSPPLRVVFLCHGNICRSPYAEAAFRAALPAELREEIRVCSAGFHKSGRPSPEEARLEAASRGLDLSEHRSRLLDRETVEVADLLVVMDARQARRLEVGFLAALREAARTGGRAVRDRGHDEVEVEHAEGEASGSAGEEALSAGQGTAVRASVETLPSVLVLGDLDSQIPPRRAIRDPYGQSREVFADVFDRIDRCIGTLADLLRGP